MKHFLTSILFGFYLPVAFAAGNSSSGCSSWISCGLNGLSGQAAFEEIARVEQEQNQKVLEQFSGEKEEIVSRLVAYKQQVAATSYHQTLRLCMAYREAMGLGRPHATAGEYSLDDSIKAWGEIYGHGLYQTVDGIVGLKSDYIEVSGEGVFDFSTWFKSMYTLNFLSSTGFLYGASHCLNTVNAREIQKFAAAVMIVDYEGTLSSQIGLNLSLSRLITLISGPLSRWVLHPLGSAFAKISQRLPLPSKVIVGGAVGIIAFDGFNCHMAKMGQAEERMSRYLEETTQNNNQVLAQKVRIGNAIKVARALRTANKACANELLKNGRTEECQQAFDSLKTVIDQTNFEREIPLYKADLEAAGKKTVQPQKSPVNKWYCEELVPLVPPQGKAASQGLYKDYLEILAVIVPVVEALKVNIH